ncbi:FMN-binding protein [Sporolactobacillus kofuensis]|uniref:FMN-binding protein n=1 Tax=Sporolactobacillus kofuensis TaxID=269672 RepID=A0ABW1WJR6_9BACL|nr:FMN-binding protein [Sporolactobacillus kofuensis]MCO7176524.1 FMN-binding protein [Sporolactobacillus kofuensis]
MSKISPKWMALCSAAIGLTYAAGYVVTEPKTAPVSAATQQVQLKGSTSKNDQQSSSSSSSSQASQSNTKKQANQSSSSSQTQSIYKDGSYSGEGMNRIGSVAVSVTIQKGKIERVQITDCTTSYPERLIDQLPQQVVSRQSSNVDNVSGATESTDNFKTAVMDALSKAKA